MGDRRRPPRRKEALNVESIVEAIDRQLILIDGVRDPRPGVFLQRRRRKLTLRPAPTSTASHRHRQRGRWSSLQYEFDFETCRRQAGANPTGATAPSNSPDRPMRSMDVGKVVTASTIRPLPDPASKMQTTALRRPLASSVPVGPVVVKPADVARIRDKKTVEQSRISQPVTKSGLDALIEAASARSGLKPARLS